MIDILHAKIYVSNINKRVNNDKYVELFRSVIKRYIRINTGIEIDIDLYKKYLGDEK